MQINIYPYQLQTKEARKKAKKTILENYRSGRRKPVFLGEKRPKHALVMKKLYIEGKWKPPIMLKENNPAWKGKKASYSAFHHWLGKHKKRDFWCQLKNHPIVKKSEFANITGFHDHNINNYIECCTSCHRLFDYHKLYYSN